MVDIRRFGKADSGRVKLTLPNYSLPLNFIAQNDALDTAISKLDHAIVNELDAKTHNSLQSINGDSPYYHIATAVYQALIPYGGYSPGSGNPFSTVDWVSAQISSANVKRAWGTANPNTFVNFVAGSVGSGSYNGDWGSGVFSQVPGICVSNWEGSAQSNSHSHGWQIQYGSLTTSGFSISRSNSYMAAPRCFWLAVGK